MFVLSASVNGEAPQSYQASFDDNDSKYKFCSIEEKLFMQLSELALRRYGNCTIYQMELMDIIGAVQRGDSAPQFPVELGTTSFGFP